MKKCNKCQHENSQEAVFCNNCGSPLPHPCPQCGAENLAEAKFCMKCGYNLETVGDGIPADSGISRKSIKKEAERRQLTILFCDLVGSTPLSEQLDPEEYRQVITDYHRVAEIVIRKNGGHIAQYLGDGLLTYFGYPKGLEDAPRAGVKTGLGILEAMAQANREWEAAGKIPVSVRIGIHTGLVVVDDHLALGEAVNIAARLEGLAPHNGLVISPQTFKLTYGWFEAKSMGKQSLKGITEPMEIFQVLHESGAITRLDVAKSRGLSPLVGRGNELDILTEYWKKAKKGNGSLILLYGEAGIGKSRLVDTIEEKVTRETGSKVAVARGSAYQQNSPFYPIVEMLGKDIFQFDDTDGTEEKLTKIEQFLKGSSLDIDPNMSLIAEFLSISSEKYPPLVISPFSKRQKTMDCISQILLSQADLQPLLFILEDLHWVDASTLEWLNLFLEKIEGTNVLILCTTRPGFKVPWQERSDFKQINLQRLSPKSTLEICIHQTNGKTLPDEILQQITAKTEGVPLFVEELIKTIMESNILVDKGNSFEVAGPLSSMAIPSTLQDSLIARLDRLDEVKEVVQIGSVLGREFSVDILKSVLPIAPDKLEQSLSRLIESEILYPSEAGQQNVYQFKHALIQDAAYESLLRRRRQQIHCDVASVLEKKFARTSQAQPELLAHHYTQAGQPLQAIPLWLKAGQMASQKNATSEAIVHLEKGLGLLNHITEEAEQKNLELDFLLTLGGVFVVSHGFPHPKVKETFNRARDIAQTIAVSPKLALILFNLLSYYFNTEDYKAHGELANYMLQLAEDAENGYWFELFACQLVGGVGIIKGEFKQANRSYNRVLEIFNPSLPFPWELSPSGYIEVGAKAWQMVCLQILGHMDQAKYLADHHLPFAEKHKDSMTLYHIYTFPALYMLEAREWEAAEKILDEYLPMVKAFGDPVFTLTAEVYYHIAKAFQGDRSAFDTAVNLINVCFDIGFKAFAVTMSPYIGEQYFRIGQEEAAQTWIEKILDHVNRTGSHIHTAELFRIKGITLQSIGKPAETVEENLKHALELSRKQSAKTYELRAAMDLAGLWHKKGKTVEAYELVKEVYDWFKEGHDSVDLKNARKILEELKK